MTCGINESRLLTLGLALALLAAVGCEPSTGLDCDPETTLDCGFVVPRTFSLTVQVTAEGGTGVPGASVRFESFRSCCAGVYWVETTDAQGRAEFGFGYSEDSPPLPIEVHVTPPPGSHFSATAVSDTIVYQERGTYLVLPIVLSELVLDEL